jgi:hypothetical protein
MFRLSLLIIYKAHRVLSHENGGVEYFKFLFRYPSERTIKKDHKS